MSNDSITLTDSALLDLFDEKGHTWLVRGGRNGVLGMAPDLQSAMVLSYEQGANQIVQAVVRQPSDNIIIVPDQIARLWGTTRSQIATAGW